MMKVYECYPMININGDWERTTFFPATRLLEEVPTEIIHYRTFEELFQSNRPYISTGLTLTKKKACYISTTRRDFAKKITEKNFPKEGIQYGWTYKEIKHPTMEYLMKYLSADDLIKYLKERDFSLENLLTNK